MPPATGPALIILVAFALPGFVTVLIQERTFKSAEDPTTLDRLLRILYYSVWSYLLLAVAAIVFGVDRAYIEQLYEQNEGDPAELVWRGALVILIPSIVIATATRAWSGSKAQALALRFARINERHEEPTGWDYFFQQRGEAYVRVTFKDGGRVYGYYGPYSFAAYAKDGRDLYLERVYAEDDDWFGPESAGTCGVWVKTEDAVAVEFYSRADAGTEETPAEASSRETPALETPGDSGPRAAQAPGSANASAAAASASASASAKERLVRWARTKLRKR
jgi:Family of unknown function (DUF6338)